MRDGESMFFKILQNADGTVKSPEEIKKILADKNVDFSKKIITSCNSGMTASYLFAALKHAGHENTRLYDGSFSEYSKRK